MRTLLLLLAFGCALASPARAAGLFGLWLTEDHDGVIAIEHCAGGLCGRVVGLVLDRGEAMPVDNLGRTRCGLQILHARQTGANLWAGQVTDPRNGRTYQMEMWLAPNGVLRMRGYLGIPLLGATQAWNRYAGSVPAGCRIASGH